MLYRLRKKVSVVIVPNRAATEYKLPNQYSVPTFGYTITIHSQATHTHVWWTWNEHIQSQHFSILFSRARANEDKQIH